MSETTDQPIAGLMIPLREGQLLVPNVTIAELVGYVPPEADEGGPDWFLGTIIWRDQRVPLVSFEAANGQTFDTKRASERTVIVNGTSGSDNLPFYALVVEGIPHAVRVGAEEAVAQDGDVGDCGAAMVHFSGEEALIPDLIKLEEMIIQAL
ncbi:chemotaxis protein CheW [Aestuariirhabdus sp. Z084]|uniref:chemotaxis protein CheW n=1 Tax=Aestuariirhabdus haliotis TaxID=2918751 RepID=UPI00201B3EBB|nr:chemotaxis protein CheW [Aestuariirhabdus haliotis]MCL6414131.1 chemotaxis protein CheW [Aestuariirhabdus haliotis]MCL6418063.1 chemotaxis protein CheW [Aestuariirhabdus haliotis]